MRQLPSTLWLMAAIGDVTPAGNVDVTQGPHGHRMRRALQGLGFLLVLGAVLWLIFAVR